MSRPICGCGNLCSSKGKDRSGTVRYGTACSTCRRTARRTKGYKCIRCHFIPEDPIQLDVDHIDGDRQNNDPSNLQTLCANCHRLKTKINNDWIKNEKM